MVFVQTNCSILLDNWLSRTWTIKANHMLATSLKFLTLLKKYFSVLVFILYCIILVTHYIDLEYFQVIEGSGCREYTTTFTDEFP